MFNVDDSVKMHNIPPLRCDIYDNMTLLTSIGKVSQHNSFAMGAFTETNNAIAQVHRIAGNRTSQQLPRIKARVKSSQEVIYGGFWSRHWGHFLIETLQRLWYAKKSDLPIVWAGARPPIDEHTSLTSWQKEILSLLGINNEHIFLTEPTQFRRVHIPEPGFSLGTWLHPEHAQFLGKFEGRIIQGKKIYISRTQLKRKNCLNEFEIEEILKKRGWKIVYPETLSVQEQLTELSSAEVCCMVTGSAQHTLLLAKNTQTKFIMLPRFNNRNDSIIANYKVAQYFQLNNKKKIIDKGKGRNWDIFTYDIEEFTSMVEKTRDFLDIANFPTFFTCPQQLTLRQMKVSSKYYEPPKPISYEKKIFYAAMLLYKQGNIKAAYILCKRLYERNLLEDFMEDNVVTIFQEYGDDPVQTFLTNASKRSRFYSIRNMLLMPYLKKKAFALINENKINEAEAIAQNVITNNPNISWPYYILGRVKWMQNYRKLSLACIQKAIDIDPHITYYRKHLKEKKFGS